MAIQQLLYEPELTGEQIQLRSSFFEQTGYGPSDLLSISYSTRTFLTRNGGKYQLDSHNLIAWLAGPSPTVEERDQWEL